MSSGFPAKGILLWIHSAATRDAQGPLTDVFTTFPRAVSPFMAAAMLCLDLPCLNEFSGVVLSSFTLSRQTSRTEVLLS